jgi:twinkle protein
VNVIPDTIDLSNYLKPPDFAAKVKPASSWVEEVIEFFGTPPYLRGCKLPWGKSVGRIALREGEVSLWPGMNYSGKSLITGQVALGLMRQGERVCIASLEMKPYKTMQRMTRQAAAGKEPSVDYMRAFHRWTDQRLWIFDHMGEVEAAKMLALTRYCADKLAIRHFFIDSLMKCVRGEDDYNGQKDFVAGLCSVALQSGMHIHLVHHTRKPADDSHQPSRFDSKGSGAITDQVDNVFTTWRNKPKERAIEKAEMERAQAPEAVLASPDTLLICDKQRHGEWDGKIGLYFDEASQAYRDRQDGRWQGLDLDDAMEPGSDG